MVATLNALLARRLVRLGLVLVVVALLLRAQTGTVRAALPAYGCGSPHCYATVQWVGNNDGVWTDILVVSLGCDFFFCGFNHGFVDNETWLSTTACLCWVEAGYGTVSPWFSEYSGYFWADQRPGSGYFDHELGTVPSRDVGQHVHAVILADAPGTQLFNVWLWTDVGTYYYAVSTSNTMHADKITIGQELAGIGGSSAGHSSFFNTALAITPVANNTFYGWYEWTNGYVRNGSPPFDTWLVPPSASSTGGAFSTWCC